MKLSRHDIAALRLAGSGLVEPFDSVTQCAENLLGIQAQAQQFAEISIFNRVRDVSGMDELFESGRIIKIWGHRMTVHLHSAGDWETIRHIHGNRNNHIQKGWSDKKKYYDLIMAELPKLMEKGVVAKEEIAEMIERLASPVKDPYRDQSILMQATLDGLIYAVAQRPNIKYYAHRRNCGISGFGEWNEQIRRQQLQKAMRIYFRHYGPATFRDFCHWTGLTRAETIGAFEEISGELETVTSEGKKLLYPKTLRPEVPDISGRVRLLGKFDPLFVSYSDKSWIADEKARKEVWRIAAHVEATVLDQGTLVATWRYEQKGNKLTFNIYPLSRITAPVRKKIAAEAERIAEFMGKKVAAVNY